jgi:hypothetical protein
MAKALNINFKTVATIAVILLLWNLLARVPAWIAQPTSLLSPGGKQTIVLTLSFYLTLFSTWFATYRGFTLRQHQGYDLFLQASRNPSDAMHQQVQNIRQLNRISLVVSAVGLVLGNDWRSGFYLLYVTGAFVYLYGIWQQANLSDRLAQSQ